MTRRPTLAELRADAITAAPIDADRALRRYEDRLREECLRAASPVTNPAVWRGEPVDKAIRAVFDRRRRR